MAPVSVAARLLALSTVVGACSGPSGDVRRELEAAERTEAAQKAQTRQLFADAELLTGDFEATARSFEDAATRWRAAAATSDRASMEYAAAESAFNEAAWNYKVMAYILVAAASYDMAGEICSGVESTQQYRRRLGITGDRTLCVDHVFAHARGGINHRWNYAVIDCRLNSAYGASFAPKIADMPLQLLQGVATSAVARLRCAGAASAWRR